MEPMGPAAAEEEEEDLLEEFLMIVYLGFHQTSMELVLVAAVAAKEAKVGAMDQEEQVAEALLLCI